LIAHIKKLQPSCAPITNYDERRHYWKSLLQKWRLPSNVNHFPGANPVSIDRSAFTTLRTTDLVVALKTDGVRYILFMTTKNNSSEPISIMIDRTLNMYEIEVWANEEFYYKNSIFDGELVWSDDDQMQYIVFDVILLKGMRCVEMCYKERLQVINNSILYADSDTDNDVIVEQRVAEEDKIIARNNDFNLQILPKICVQSTQICELWNNRKKCSHRNDGLILTFNNYHIDTGTSKSVFKWKPSHSIDIKCYFSTEWRFYANANASDEEVELSTLFKLRVDNTLKLLDMLQPKQKCVIECIINVVGDEIVLVPERERTDKKAANTVKTIKATVVNAEENISIKELAQVFSGDSESGTADGGGF